MIFLYTTMLLLLGVARFLIGRRVANLEKRHSKFAKAAEEHLKALKGGYSTKVDPCQIAKSQYQLGYLAQKRDRLEAKHDAWLTFAEKFSRTIESVRAWKGRKLPYTFGVLDVSMILYGIDYLGVGQYVNAAYLMDLVAGLVNQ